MSALLDRLLGSIVASPTENSEMSGSFQSGFGGGDYDYSGTGVDRSDHHGGHSGYHHHSGSYHDNKCCPLVVDALCLAAILGAIAGAAVLLSRVFQIELTGRRKKRFAESEGGLWHWRRVLDGKQARSVHSL